MDAKPFRFLYQDESGDVGHGQPHFIIGLLMVREREPLWAAVRRARDRWHYANELHFEKMSNLRMKVYEAVLDAIAVEAAHFRYEALAVPREDVNVGFVSDQRHLAYNYFTKLLLENRCQEVENAVMYADAKSRVREDNFLEYLVVEMNLGVPFRKGLAPRRVLKKVEPLDSKSDDLLQVTDLLTGCVNNRLGHPAGERKQRLRRRAEELGLLSDQNIRVWKPKSERP
jgi:Protein of unknown function (DUF3800)